MVLHRLLVDCRGVHAAIYETYVVYWFSRDLCSLGGGGGVNLPWVYVHCVIYETYLVS